MEIASQIAEGAYFGVYEPLENLLGCAAYSSRAWTFQEQLLARRVVYFVDDRVFFRCQEKQYAEQLIDHKDEPHLPIQHTLSPPLSSDLSDPIPQFARLVEAYTKRALTDQKDVLRAMAGIIRRMSVKTNGRFLQGLPVAALDAFLLFRGDGQALRRRQGFPSYSWTGWRGEISFGLIDVATSSHLLKRWLVTRTWTLRQERTPSGLVGPIDPTTKKQRPSCDPPSSSSNADTFSFTRYRSRGLSKALDVCRVRPRKPSPQELTHLDYSLLQFWALTVRFKLRIGDAFSSVGCLETGSGVDIGEIQVDAIDRHRCFPSEEPVELAVLSERTDGIWHKPPTDYFVMLLEWNGPVAERRGVGTLKIEHLEDGFSPGLKWKGDSSRIVFLLQPHRHCLVLV
ncbi:hypothetical protein CSOJ01_08885 [Colletotrichum sojae]|uniref:Heterokaryon incompatibility domain-containing protein n=1 Tax=Colletotrichum sojae TaxID=2175907 RepID=A0A8H6MSB5_9PEZI|nr:hypothetical protein CSOJ01_08885 [Colletotrichum sojae]